MKSLAGTPRRRRILPVVGIASVALALSACGATNAGAAATFGDDRITVSELQEQVTAVLEAQGQPATAADAAITNTALGRMLTMELVDILAQRQGIEVSQGQLDEITLQYVAQNGGQEAFDAMLVQQGIVPSQAQDVIRLQVQAQELGVVLDPNGSAESQGMAVREAVVELGDELDVTVNPRYGTWNPAQLAVGPAPEDVATLPSAE